MKVKVSLKTNDKKYLPQRMSQHAAGSDLVACLEKSIEIDPGTVKIIPTGISIEVPQGYEAQVRPRSGLAFKHGITVLNTPGTIDADYRGEVKVILINHGEEAFLIEDGMRIAQLIINKVEIPEFELSEELSDTKRGSGGFGHTGH
ncbi:MAG: dUTP diphosphatase [Candidatus Muiribacterium halophilum]|uniref:Deoxyuridine 5'-triphosphate nucleotidohydrolase n=1 Tax=Muiribacterium halophilum TaxID=2053465 RepID=A0A2N5ZC22_MUIH1|nr:MAG: dUTP diphosphatase [Candidatus Muirbacterium halophilum]